MEKMKNFNTEPSGIIDTGKEIKDYYKSDIELAEERKRKKYEEDMSLYLKFLEKGSRTPEEVPKEFWKDESFVTRAVRIDGMYLMYGDKKIRANKKIVLEAVSQNKRASFYAHDSIREEIERSLQN